MSISEATSILRLIRSEVSSLAGLVDAADGDEPHLRLIKASDRARQVAAWITMGESLGLTWEQITGSEPMLSVDTDQEAEEILSDVRTYLESLRSAAEEIIPLDETDHYGLMQSAGRFADRAAALLLIEVCESTLGHAQIGRPLSALAAAQRAADKRAAEATARLRKEVRFQMELEPSRSREVMRETGISSKTLARWLAEPYW